VFKSCSFCRENLSEEDRIALQNEIDILMQVDHPNIVKMQDVYDDEDHFYIVLELMTGGEVSDKRIHAEFSSIWY